VAIILAAALLIFSEDLKPHVTQNTRSHWSRRQIEFDGELGHLEGAHLIPLDQLRDRIDEVSKDRPVVTVCQSGNRSGMAAEILLKAGFEEVANVAGGLIHWSRLALPHREVSLPADWSI